jgi:hypothetical protein
MSESGHRSCKCGAVYDRSEHIAEACEISSFECVTQRECTGLSLAMSLPFLRLVRNGLAGAVAAFLLLT